MIYVHKSFPKVLEPGIFNWKFAISRLTPVTGDDCSCWPFPRPYWYHTVTGSVVQFNGIDLQKDRNCVEHSLYAAGHVPRRLDPIVRFCTWPVHLGIGAGSDV